MARLSVHTIDDAPPASAELLASILAASPTGKPLNMQAQMAGAPATLAAYVSMRRAVDEHATLEPRQRAAVMMVAAAAFGVEYVEAVTAMLGQRAGWSEPAVAGLRNGTGSGDDTLDGLLAVVAELCANAGQVSDETWAGALERGWTTAQLTEVFAFVAIVGYSAFFVNFARTELDLPVPTGTRSA
jgi:alkylhydroperoxidase family enzyme